MADGADIRHELKKLLSLQKVDEEIFSIKSSLEDIPLRESEIKNALEAKKAGMNEAETKLNELQVLKGEKEMDIESKETKVTKYQADLYGIKNNKDFEALKNEIGSIKADISVIEDELLELFDTIEAAKTKLAEEKQKFEKESEKASSELAELNASAKKLKEDVKEQSGKRDDLSKDIDPEIMAQYDRILEKWGKTAVSLIQGEFCGECNMQLRPQLINATHIARDIVLCENCSRILYAENENDD